MIEVRQASLLQLVAAHALIPEFALGGEAYLRDRLEGKTSLSLIGSDGERIAGYLVAYMQGDAAYIWLAGTSPAYRGQGVFTSLVERVRRWAVAEGAVKLQIKTTNSFRSMLSWLAGNGFLFVDVELRENPEENRIFAELPIGTPDGGGCEGRPDAGSVG